MCGGRWALGVCCSARTACHVGGVLCGRRHDAHSTYLRRVLLSVPVVGLAQPARLAEPPLVRVALEGATSAALHTVRTVAVDSYGCPARLLVTHGLRGGRGGNEATGAVLPANTESRDVTEGGLLPYEA